MPSLGGLQQELFALVLTLWEKVGLSKGGLQHGQLWKCVTSAKRPLGIHVQ